MRRDYDVCPGGHVWDGEYPQCPVCDALPVGADEPEPPYARFVPAQPLHVRLLAALKRPAHAYMGDPLTLSKLLAWAAALEFGISFAYEFWRAL